MTPEADAPRAKLSLSPELLEAVHRVAGTEQLLVAMDFDGTMAPLVDHAEDSRALPRSAAAFAALAELPRTTTRHAELHLALACLMIGVGGFAKGGGYFLIWIVSLVAAVDNDGIVAVNDGQKVGLVC